MSSTAGDKIGITTATAGGSVGTWGTEYFNAFVLLDEAIYAAREDRNNVILGGGKISWDGSQLAFTADIEIRNHITAFINKITTAASPRTLDASHKVAYVQLTRKPAADNSITGMTLVAAGSLPNGTTDADFGTLVIAYRTVDGTVVIPWARRELLSGDHWQFGAAQSWYERTASANKPPYKSNTADNTQVLIPGSATSPAVVVIDGKLYANTSNAILDLDTAGRNGLDTGSKANNTSYYLYAIPPTSGRTFDVVCSVTAPSGAGPTGFSSWSYIGSFLTDGSSNIRDFQARNGIVIYTDLNSGWDVGTTNASPATAKTMKVPGTAAMILIRLTWAAINAAGDSFLIGSTAAGAQTRSKAQSTTIANNAVVDVWVAMLTASTVYTNVTTVTTDSVDMRTVGWMENPMEFK